MGSACGKCLGGKGQGPSKKTGVRDLGKKEHKDYEANLDEWTRVRISYYWHKVCRLSPGEPEYNQQIKATTSKEAEFNFFEIFKIGGSSEQVECTDIKFVGPGTFYQKIKVYNYFSYGDCSTKAKKMAIRDNGYKFKLNKKIEVPLKHFAKKVLKGDAEAIRQKEVKKQKKNAESGGGAGIYVPTTTKSSKISFGVGIKQNNEEVQKALEGVGQEDLGEYEKEDISIPFIDAMFEKGKTEIVPGSVEISQEDLDKAKHDHDLIPSPEAEAGF